MSNLTSRQEARKIISARSPVSRPLPMSPQGKFLKVSQYFGENVFYILENKSLKKDTRDALHDVLLGKKNLSKEMAQDIASVVLDWALEKGVTHFCHWFQPLTGETAEKHDSFISFEGDRPIEKLSASQLIQGEPDASSFPNGGSRSTFEARGYTTWDFSSPIFIKDGTNGKTLYIPTAFISYHGDALDNKTPLIRSNNVVTNAAKKFMNLCGFKDSEHITVTCGPEQEYFLVDKAHYFGREDLVMTGRTLIGSLTSRHQQLEDHYFAQIPERILAFMQDVEIELYQLGIPAKTRHNEVAPAQFEMAPIFKDANLANDQNRLVMDCLKRVADRHHFVCLLHEKPFRGVNGSGKHLNWSMSDDKGRNLLEPGKTPHENYCFLAMVSIVCKAVHKHSIALRSAIASHGNDHRLGANEAPPSIMSVFLGSTITDILEKFSSGTTYSPEAQKMLDIGANQIMKFLKDNTDRNRTSPFAFTGNKFEFRAVGASAAIGLPLAVLNAAVADILIESNQFIENGLKQGSSLNDVLAQLIRDNYLTSKAVVFNGDGYSQDWVKEAEKRGLPNLRTSPEALVAFYDEKYHKFLLDLEVYRPNELTSLLNVRLERYIKHRYIEFDSLKRMIDRHILPAAMNYRSTLLQSLLAAKELGVSAGVEKKSFDQLNVLCDELSKLLDNFWNGLKNDSHDEKAVALKYSAEYLPLTEKLADLSNQIENMLPEELMSIPSYYEMLFVK